MGAVGHDDEQVHVAIGTRIAARRRAKEYDLYGVDHRHDPAHQLIDCLFAVARAESMTWFSVQVGHATSR